MSTTCVYVCVSVYVKSPLRDSHLSRRVSASLSPRALVLRPAREGLETRVCEAYLCPRDRSRSRARSMKRETRSRSEKRSGMVMLSTSSRSRHSLSILYILFFCQTRFSPFVTFRFVCVSFFFFFVRLSSPQSRWRVHCVHLP